MVDAYTAEDTLVIKDKDGEYIETGFADASIVQIEASNDLSEMTTGYNGNTLAAHNEPGRQRLLTLRLVKGSAGDKRMNKNFTLWKDNRSAFEPLEFTFTKLIKHNGSQTTDTLTLFFGIPANPGNQEANTAGSTDQVVQVYTIKCGDYKRSLT